MADPSAGLSDHDQALLKLLDAIGSEATIRSTLHGGTVETHLAWLAAQSNPTHTAHS
jgi:hypothetical protein